jgi:hypothetical protein
MTRRDDLVKLRDAVGNGGAPLMELMTLAVSVASDRDEYAAIINAYRSRSLDAARELHDATMPGAFWHIGHLDQPSLGYVATVAHRHYADSPSWRGFNMCPARAWLIAILETIIAQEDAAQKGDGE